MVDPDPRVSGLGLANLQRHNITVTVGVEESLCLSLNSPFLFRNKYKRPLVSVWSHICMDKFNCTYMHVPNYSDVLESFRDVALECEPSIITIWH